MRTQYRCTSAATQTKEVEETVLGTLIETGNNQLFEQSTCNCCHHTYSRDILANFRVGAAGFPEQLYQGGAGDGRQGDNTMMRLALLTPRSLKVQIALMARLGSAHSGGEREAQAVGRQGVTGYQLLNPLRKTNYLSSLD